MKDKLDPQLKHIIPRSQALRGKIPKGTALHSDAVLASPEVESDPYTTTVLCKTCRAPLWRVTAKTDHRGNLVSAKTEEIVVGCDRNNPVCPLCKGLYFDVRDNGTPRFLTSKGMM